VIEQIVAATNGLGVECAMDCSSSSTARSQAIRSCRKWGRVAFVGEGGDVTIDVSSDMLRKQLTVLGSWTFTKQAQADCARFVAEKGINVDALFTDEWQLDDVVSAYQQFDKQEMGKGVLIP
jgi:L-iditol 2-dehydrogenase